MQHLQLRSYLIALVAIVLLPISGCGHYVSLGYDDPREFIPVADVELAASTTGGTLARQIMRSGNGIPAERRVLTPSDVVFKTLQGLSRTDAINLLEQDGFRCGVNICVYHRLSYYRAPVGRGLDDNILQASYVVAFTSEYIRTETDLIFSMLGATHVDYGNNQRTIGVSNTTL